MLNIISRSLVSKHTRGPKKVVLNLMKGLDELKYPYVVNHALDATNMLWIHDDLDALKQARHLPARAKVLVGPNVITKPSEIPLNLPQDKLVWLHPSSWVQNFWNMSGGDKLHSDIWATGIDTELFSPKTTATKEHVLVYQKQRSDEDVNRVCGELDKKSLSYKVITYGNYTEESYQALLAKSQAVIWIGRSESQGVALEEALSMNIPILVWDVKKFGDWSGPGKDFFTEAQLDFGPVSAAPYFDETCGRVFSNQSDLSSEIDIFLENLSVYSPRTFVLNNLSLKKQAQEFINIFKNIHNVTEAELRNTALFNKKVWKNATLSFKIATFAKDALRSLIR